MIVVPQVIIVVSFNFCFFFTASKANREGKSLLSSFPFSHSEHHEHQHGDHQAASPDGSVGRNSRQGYGGEDDADSVSFDEISTGEEEADGKGWDGYCWDYKICYSGDI